jgi:hypothetical protein
VTATVLVADPGLGTINAVRLCAGAITGAGLPPPVVVLNRFDAGDPLHRANRAWLEERDGLHCVVDVRGLAMALDPGPPRRPGCAGVAIDGGAPSGTPGGNAPPAGSPGLQ